MSTRRRCALFACLCLALTGCQSPYRSDQGALFGGLLGAGTGALVGSAVGHTGAGAAVGAGVGALSGAVVGNQIDQIDAQNQAQIAAQMGRQLRAGAVTIDDVVSMSKAGVSQELIVNHVRTQGMAGPLQANDLIFLQQQGVSPTVVQAMQSQPAPTMSAAPPPMLVAGPPPPVVLVGDPYWGSCYRPYPRRYCPPGPGVSWGVSFSDCR